MTHVVLITESPGVGDAIRKAFDRSSADSTLTIAATLDEATDRLGGELPDIVLVDARASSTATGQDPLHAARVAAHFATTEGDTATDKDSIPGAVESTMTGVSRLDQEGRFVSAADSLAAMLGYRPEELVGKPWSETISSDDTDALVEALDQMHHKGRAELEVEALRQGGGTVHIHALLTRREGRNGEPDGCHCFTRSIERRVRALQQKRELEDQLRQSQKLEAVGTLASGVAHDFNNVLFAINGYIDLAVDTLEEGHPAADWLSRVQQACKQAGGLTRSLLTFSQKAPKTMTHVDWASGTSETLGLLRRLLPASVELEERIPEDALWIHADPNQLQQVLVNLTVNARDSMPEGGKLVIELGKTVPSGFEDMIGSDEPDSYAYLTVIDNGSGIPEAIRSRVLEPFFTTKRRDQGTGLGLSVVHGIVNDHRGHIQFVSSDGEGTTFVIALPRCAAPEETAEHESPAETRMGAGELILLAEDNKQVLEILERGFVNRSYRVISASDGDETMRLFAAHKDEISAAVLDVDLPKRSGLSCLEEMRGERPDLHIIVESGRLDPGLDALENLTVLSKPFPMSALFRAIERALASDSSRND